MKSIVAINDLSGIGNCSLSVTLPILAVMGLNCYPYPTAVLSCQTAFDNYSFLDLTSEMINYKKSWETLNKKFDCIYTGFLGSIDQIDIVNDFISNHNESLIFVDPVMGDDGSIYDTFSDEMCYKMRELVKSAHIITPNITEALILTNNLMNINNISFDMVRQIARELIQLGPSQIVITGIVKDNKIYNFAFDKKLNKESIVSFEYNNKSYSGTGDIFASILCGMLLKGSTLEEATKGASTFIYKGIAETSKDLNRDPREGINYQLYLGTLI